MPLLSDRDEICRRLRQDPGWAVYALGDLGPELWPKTTWHADREQIALVLRAFSFPILWASGDLEELVSEVVTEARYSVQVRPSSLPALSRYYQTEGLKRMWRMTLDPAAFRPQDGEIVRLGEQNVAELERLYADGSAAGESPEFFFSAMVRHGVFFACRDADGLTAVAGTHLVERTQGVGAIGNVYTRRDCRGRGLAGQVTSAVVQELLRLNVATIALNVYQSNARAIQVYERLGFRRHCDFVEGMIERC